MIHTLSALAVRLAGIVIGLYAVRAGVTFLYSARLSSDEPWLFVALTPLVMMLSASVCMIFFPRTIAGKFVPVMGGETKDPPSVGDLEHLGTALLGLYFLVQVVLDVTYMITLWFAYKEYGTKMSWTPDHVATLAVAAVEFGLAVWLLLGARGLFGLLRWARSTRAG